jgi:hypothetical protein
MESRLLESLRSFRKRANNHRFPHPGHNRAEKAADYQAQPKEIVDNRAWSPIYSVMKMRRTFSFSLVAWVGLACPIICGFRVDSGDRERAPTGCCNRHDTPSDAPAEPSDPDDEGADHCFCSAHGVIAGKSQLSLTSLFALSFEYDASLALQVGEFHLQPEPREFPPDAYRVLPLLI